jgi:hypothetical protein
MKEQRDTTQPAGGSPVERGVSPCPWCGSPAEVEDDFARNWRVQCTNLEACGCTDGRLYESAAEAVRMWNRTPCAHPACLDNDDERCPRWLTGECAGPNVGAEPTEEAGADWPRRDDDNDGPERPGGACRSGSARASC